MLGKPQLDQIERHPFHIGHTTLASLQVDHLDVPPLPLTSSQEVSWGTFFVSLIAIPHFELCKLFVVGASFWCYLFCSGWSGGGGSVCYWAVCLRFSAKIKISWMNVFCLNMATQTSISNCDGDDIQSPLLNFQTSPPWHHACTVLFPILGPPSVSFCLVWTGLPLFWDILCPDWYQYLRQATIWKREKPSVSQFQPTSEHQFKNCKDEEKKQSSLLKCLLLVSSSCCTADRKCESQ